MHNVSTVLTISAGPHSLTEAQHIYYRLADAGRDSAYDGSVIRRTSVIHLSSHHQTTLKTSSTADHSGKPGTGLNKVGVPRLTKWALASVGPLYIITIHIQSICTEYFWLNFSQNYWHWRPPIPHLIYIVSGQCSCKHHGDPKVRARFHSS